MESMDEVFLEVLPEYTALVFTAQLPPNPEPIGRDILSAEAISVIRLE